MKLFLIILFLPLQLFSQNGVERLRTDSDVVQFVKSHAYRYVGERNSKHWQDVGLDIFGRHGIYRDKLNTDDRHFTDSVTRRQWIVEDFNDDQQKDLVFYGRIGSTIGVFVFIPENDSAGQVIFLTDIFANHFPNSIESIKKDGTNWFILGSFIRPEWGSKEIKPMRERYYKDTLVYKFGGFVEYNKKPEAGPSFDSVHFRTISTWSYSSDYFMRLYKNGTAEYIRNRDSVDAKNNRIYLLEKLTTKIDVSEWKSLFDYMKFETLNDDYRFDASDQTTAIVTVYYSNGKKKMVRDYGMRGNFGLQALYHKLYEFSKTGDWQLVKRGVGWMYSNTNF